MLENIVAQYDAEHDAGRVTWVDMQLVKALKQLERDMFNLQQRLEDLENRHDVTQLSDIMSTMSPAEFVALEADAITDADAVEAMDAAVYDAHHVEWELERERNDLRDEVKRLRTALREISTLEGADPDGIVWTWKQLFCKAEDIAKQALEVDG